MHEFFLHYIWQLQYFDKKGLKTIQGEDLQVLRPGILNTHAGPDFSNSKIRIGDMAWAGTVEIHMKSSEWNVHFHHRDKAYDNVILHVVWQNDKQVIREDGTEMPTLELKGRIDDSLLIQYRKLMTSGFTIPCSQSFEKVPDIVKLDMLDKALLQRLEKKSAEILNIFKKNGKDWEETTYQLLARNFGFKINADPFFQLARCVPYKYLIRHIDHPQQIEALLFGQAGFLEKNMKDEYHKKLQKEYKFLSVKYELSHARLDASQWKFLRMRPANFPTLRLAQFCDLLIRQRHLFSRILEASAYETMFGLFEAEQRDYWKSHYTFGSPVKRTICKLGSSSIDNILVNTVAPLLVAYGKDRDDQSFVDRAEKLLQRVPGEENSILKSWGDLGWKVKSAFDSQALIELYHLYCVPRRCLQCSIGSALLKPGG